MSPFRIFLVVFIALFAIALGLLFRRLLVHRLKKTVMDNWLIQTLGVVIALLPIILAGIAILFIILDSTYLQLFWEKFTQQLPIPDVTSVIWGFIQGLLILFIGIGIARTTVRLLQRQGHIDINLRTLLERMLNILVITITIFWTLSMAFAIQDIIKDLVAGFYILMERPFHIGDEISTAMYTGQVENIEIRATKLRLVSGEQITIPNAMVFGG